MTLFEWKDNYNTGVKVIDKQHQRLVEILNELYTAVMEIRGQEVIRGVVKSMVEYAVIHFATEEDLMQKNMYPGYPEHKKEHESFSAKAVELREMSKNDDFILSTDLLNYLKEWLNHHILVIDMKYSPFFKSKGIS